MLQRFTAPMLAAGLLSAAALLSSPAEQQATAATTMTPVVAAQKNSKEPTAEQVAELVIFVYGSRERIAQIQRNGIERGRVSRVNGDGRTEEITYERRFVRGETSEKDKIRLDQKAASAEYALVYNGGRIWGLINGTSFTPRAEAVADFMKPTQRGIDALLRYKENGATLTLAGKDKQKNIDMYMLDLVDKEKWKTRYFISTQKLRVLWLEYEDAPTGGGGSPVKFKRSCHDYRYAQGQLVPYRTVLFEDGKQVEETTVLNVTFGLKMDDSYFQSETAATAQP